jgi:hypothetical protein
VSADDPTFLIVTTKRIRLAGSPVTGGGDGETPSVSEIDTQKARPPSGGHGVPCSSA